MKKKKQLSFDIVDHIPVSVCTLDPKGKTILYMNSTFETLTGYSQQEFAEDKKTLQDIVYKKDYRKIEQRLEHLEDQHLAEELRIIRKNKSWRYVEVIIRNCAENSLFICVFRDIESQKELQESLQQEIAEEKENAAQMAKGVIRSRQLLEKIHRGPGFFRELWKCKDENTLLEKAVTWMCHEKGLQYASATVLLRDGEYLCVKASTKDQPLQRFHLQKNHKFAEIFRGEKKVLCEETGEYAIAITTPKGPIGVFQIFFVENQRAILVEDPLIKQAHWDFLECLCEFIGLLLYSLQPQETVSISQGFASLHKDLTKHIAQQDPFFIVALKMDNFLSIAITKHRQIELLLEIIGDILKTQKPSGSNIFHTSGGEFFIVIPGDDQKSVVHTAQQIQKKLQKPIDVRSQKFRCCFSIGITHYGDENKESLDKLLEQTFECLQQAQQSDSIFVWNKKPQEIPKRVSAKLQ